MLIQERVVFRRNEARRIHEDVPDGAGDCRGSNEDAQEKCRADANERDHKQPVEPRCTSKKLVELREWAFRSELEKTECRRSALKPRAFAHNIDNGGFPV